MTAPWLDDGDVRLYHGDASAVLATLPAGSVQTCVTSPPYWGLRDYGTGQWDGGDASCDHLGPPMRTNNKPTDGSASFHGGTQRANEPWPGGECGRCGARRVDDQLGLEPTPSEYVERLVSVFREVRRVLRDDGTLWLNLGDSYAATNTQQPPHTRSKLPPSHQGVHHDLFTDKRGGGRPVPGLKPKDLVGIPWRVAFALQADGWYLRSDIIWAKPNPMPESVTDRPTKAHEYVFLLSKRPKYYWDADAIREPHGSEWIGRSANVERVKAGGNGDRGDGGARAVSGDPAGRNARSVWQIATQPTPEAHFATFPEELARRCILAGTSEAGGCAECGAPLQRIVEQSGTVRDRWSATSAHATSEAVPNGIHRERTDRRVMATTGWAASCACDAPARPQTVLDPFAGSGTSLLVARHHARHAIGIDLSAEYLAIAARRLQQLSLLGCVSDV